MYVCKRRKKILEKMDIFVSKYDVISFDLYDTLIHRDVSSPVDVFELVENMCGIKNSQFKEKRIIAEKEARKNSRYDEITLDEIYKYLPYDEKQIELFKKLEISVEKELAVPDQVMLQVYNRLLELGKEIYIISDMYLPYQLIVNICEKCKIKGYKKIFLSSEFGVRKRKGKLFKKYLQDENINLKNAIHIGNDVYADCISARIVGLNSYKVSDSQYKVAYKIKQKKESVSNSLINSYIQNHVNVQENNFYKVGYVIYGPLLYSFTKWLITKVEEEKVDKIIFLARDSYIIKKAFDIIASKDFESVYFYASRKSVLGVRLQDDYSLKNIMSKVHLRQEFTIEDFLERINAFSQGNKELALKMNINLQKSISPKSANLETNINRYLELVCNQLEDKFKNETISFNKYLRQFLKKEEKIGIVDVGWNGTTQKAIEISQKKQELENEIIGYYFGVNKKKYGREVDIIVNGFLVDDKSTEEQRIKVKAIMGLLEFFLSAPHGTTCGYREGKDGVIPCTERYEFIDESGKKMREYDALLGMHRGALDFVKEFQSWEFASNVYIAAQEAMSPLFELCIKATKNELKEMGELHFYEGMLCSIASPKSILHYIKHFFAFKKDFGSSVWKIGFMKRICSNIPLPYYQIYKMLIKKYKK